MIRELPNGKHEVTWDVATVRLPNGHVVTGRPETVAALTGANPTDHSQVRRVGTFVECMKQA